jgi:hypothetical protein
LFLYHVLYNYAGLLSGFTVTGITILPPVSLAVTIILVDFELPKFVALALGYALNVNPITDIEFAVSESPFIFVIGDVDIVALVTYSNVTYVLSRTVAVYPSVAFSPEAAIPVPLKFVCGMIFAFSGIVPSVSTRGF